MRRAVSQPTNRTISMFVAPALIVYLLVMVVPTLASVWISFHDWRGVGDEAVWVGWKNYTSLIGDPTFRTSFTNTLMILIVGGAFVFGFALVFTAVLRTSRSKKTVRAVIFFPNIAIPVALAIIWGTLLAPRNGLLNGFLTAVGLESFTGVWLGPDSIFKAIVAGVIWIYAGFIATILMAGADRIPPDLFEAGEIDGASRLQLFRHVTFPLIWDVVGVATVLWVIISIKIFEFVFALGGSGTDPPAATWTLGIHIYMVALGTRSPVFALGVGSAIATVMLVLVAVAVIIVRRIFKRETVTF